MSFENKLIKNLIEDFKAHTQNDNKTVSFISALKGGNNKITQKLLSQTRYFNPNWVEEIESYTQYIDNIIRSPRSFLRNEELIVPIELAKKTSPESVRHLAANTQYIKDVDRDGFVTPSKILTVFREEDLATYENRFIRSLIDKLFIFIERRYQLMVKLATTKYINRFNMESSFVLPDGQVDYSLTMSYQKNSLQNKTEVRNLILIDKVDKLRKEIVGIRGTEFMQVVSKARPVYPPIQRTNIITKEPNYKKCHELWILLDSFEGLDVEFELYEKEYKFDNDELNNLYYLVLFGFNSIVQNINVEGELLTESNRVDVKKVDAFKNPNDFNLDTNDDKVNNSNIIDERIIERMINNLATTNKEEINAQLELLNCFYRDLSSDINDTKTKLKSQENLSSRVKYAINILNGN